jgi:hypothetical protein
VAGRRSYFAGDVNYDDWRSGGIALFAGAPFLGKNTVMERMRTEAPKVLDAYTQQKIAQIRREAERVRGSLPSLPKR